MGDGVGGVKTLENQIYPVATRTRRRGLKFAGTARSSGGHSLNSTMAAVGWDNSTYSNEVPLEVRFRSVTNGFRLTAEIGTVASNALARLVSGAGSGVYTSIAAATWSDWEHVYTNWQNASNVFGYIGCTSSAQAVIQYEVRTVPRAVV